MLLKYERKTVDMKPCIFLLLLSLVLASCSWVSENKSGQSVAIIGQGETPECQLVGTINVSTTYKIGFIKRGSNKVLDELQVLARNEAIKIDANTISPNSKPVDGKQSYVAFKCPR